MKCTRERNCHENIHIGLLVLFSWRKPSASNKAEEWKGTASTHPQQITHMTTFLQQKTFHQEEGPCVGRGVSRAPLAMACRPAVPGIQMLCIVVCE